MNAISDTEIQKRGMCALVAELGEVNAERFITLLNREPFDYTQWQRTLFSNMDVAELSALAMKARNSPSGRQD